MEEKKKMGAPTKPPEEKLVQRSIRMKEKQWAKFDKFGGIDWLRSLVDKARPPK